MKQIKGPKGKTTEGWVWCSPDALKWRIGHKTKKDALKAASGLTMFEGGPELRKFTLTIHPREKTGK